MRIGSREIRKAFAGTLRVCGSRLSAVALRHFLEHATGHFCRENRGRVSHRSQRPVEFVRTCILRPLVAGNASPALRHDGIKEGGGRLAAGTGGR